MEGENIIAPQLFQATHAGKCVFTATATVPSVNPIGPGSALVALASRKNDEPYSGVGAAMFVDPHPTTGGMLLYYRAGPVMRQVDVAPGDIWSVGCEVLASGAWVGATLTCDVSWICH